MGTIGGLLLLLLVTTHSPHDPGALVAAGMFGSLWMLGLLLAQRRSPYLARVSQGKAGIRIGRESIFALGLKASIVEAELGASVAFVWDKGEVFVETATLEDARTLVSLSQAELVDELTLRAPVPLFVRLLKVLAAMIGVIACFLLASSPYGGDLFAAVVFSGLATSALHLVESFLHRRIPLNADTASRLARGSVEKHVRLHLERRAVPRAPRVRVGVLARGAEPTREWLGRLDGISSDAYRGELPPQDDLRQILGDPASPLHDRLGAARLLVRRYGIPLAEIERAIEPEIAPYILDIGHEDAEHVTASLDRLGPVFRP